jgi:hypothetical protein
MDWYRRGGPVSSSVVILQFYDNAWLIEYEYNNIIRIDHDERIDLYLVLASYLFSFHLID